MDHLIRLTDDCLRMLFAGLSGSRPFPEYSPENLAGLLRSQYDAKDLLHIYVEANKYEDNAQWLHVLQMACTGLPASTEYRGGIKTNLWGRQTEHSEF